MHIIEQKTLTEVLEEYKDDPFIANYSSRNNFDNKELPLVRWKVFKLEEWLEMPWKEYYHYPNFTRVYAVRFHDGCGTSYFKIGYGRGKDGLKELIKNLDTWFFVTHVCYLVFKNKKEDLKNWVDFDFEKATHLYYAAYRTDKKFRDWYEFPGNTEVFNLNWKIFKSVKLLNDSLLSYPAFIAYNLKEATYFTGGKVARLELRPTELVSYEKTLKLDFYLQINRVDTEYNPNTNIWRSHIQNTEDLKIRDINHMYLDINWFWHLKNTGSNLHPSMPTKGSSDYNYQIYCISAINKLITKLLDYLIVEITLLFPRGLDYSKQFHIKDLLDILKDYSSVDHIEPSGKCYSNHCIYAIKNKYIILPRE